MIILRYFQDIFRLFYPERCAVCGCPLPQGARLLCPVCRWEMPLTGYCTEHENPVFRKFWGLLPLEEATALFFFRRNNPHRRMIHRFKYSGQWRTAYLLGNLLGGQMKDGGLYDAVDVIVPVPLHRRKMLIRGYNQSAYLAEGIARMLHRPIDYHSVVRSKYNRSQTQTAHHQDRWDNVAEVFSVRRCHALAGRHILLVDDVLTTGATLVSCAETILKDVPDCRISIAVLAVSSYELFGHKGMR